MNNSRGNALFLILIAVALFAALSYAVTNSGRGGSGVDKEQAEIDAAQIMQFFSQVQTAYTRLELIGGYDQVLFNDSDANASGTCYSGATATTPCNTIGMFSAEAGVPIPDLTPYQSSPPDNQAAVWVSARITLGASDYGTSAPDTYISLRYIDEAICDAINNKLFGSTADLTFSSGTDAAGQAANFLLSDGTIGAIATAASVSYTVPYERGCFKRGGFNNVIFLLEKH